MMSIPGHNDSSPSPTRLRSACDLCHRSKVKCSGGSPCSGCRKLRLRCNYSSSKRTGRPRGAKNKVTLQRLRILDAAEADREAAANTAAYASPSSSASSSDVPHPRVAGYMDIGANQLDTLLDWNFGVSDTKQAMSGCFDPSPVGMDDSSSDLGLMHIPSLSQDSMFSDISLSVPQSLSPELFDFGNASTIHHHQIFNRASCDCLQQLAALFVQLKVYVRGCDRFLQAAVAISQVREGVEAWKRHLQCSTCIESTDTDSLLLSVIEIRMALPVVERIHRNLDMDGQALAFVQATTEAQMPVAYGLARDESHAIMRTLLLRSVRSIVGILEEIKERASRPGQYGVFPSESGLPTPLQSPSPLLDSNCNDLLALPESPGGSPGHFGQPLLSLIESAKDIERSIAADQ